MGAVMSGTDGSVGEAAGTAPKSDVVRKLEEGVKILDFEGGKDFDGIFYVSYFPNGMCDAYTIRIGDDKNRIDLFKPDAVNQI